MLKWLLDYIDVCEGFELALNETEVVLVNQITDFEITFKMD